MKQLRDDEGVASRRGVEFDEFNGVAGPSGMDELVSRGIMTVPAAIVGDQSMSGWNPSRLGELLEMDLEEEPVAPEELVHTVRLVLDAAIRVPVRCPRAPGR